MKNIQLEASPSAQLPQESDCSILNTPYTIYARSFQNRIVFQPMEGADGTAEGTPGERPVDEPQPIYACQNELFEQEKPMTGGAGMISDVECDALSKRYYESTLLAAKCGFDGVDVKCSHGYLLSKFLSVRNRLGYRRYVESGVS